VLEDVPVAYFSRAWFLAARSFDTAVDMATAAAVPVKRRREMLLSRRRELLSRSCMTLLLTVTVLSLAPIAHAGQLSLFEWRPLLLALGGGQNRLDEEHAP